MDPDAVSPKSQPLPQYSDIPPISLPAPVLSVPPTSRGSSLSATCTEENWPPKWNPAWGFSLTPPSSLEDLKETPPLHPEDEAGSPQGISLLNQNREQSGPKTQWRKYVKRLPPVIQTQRILRNHYPSRRLQALERAIVNCRKTTIVMRDLDNLLTQLLTAQNASGCAMKVQDQTGDNDAWVIEVLMSLKQKYGIVDDSPQGVHALQRTCMWVCNQASNDIADIKIGSTTKRIVRFIDKWDDFPDHAFEGMTFKYADTGTIPPAGETDTQTQPTIISSCLNFLEVFNDIRANRRSVRVREIPNVDYLRKLLANNTNNDENDDDERAELKARCKNNIIFIQELLSHLSTELDAETTFRTTCTHRPRCKNLTSSSSSIRTAQKHLTSTILALMRVKNSLNQSTSRVGGPKKGREMEKDREKEVWMIKQWINLSKSPWFWALLMGADEVVKSIGNGQWVDEGGQRMDCWRVGRYGFEYGLEKIV